jgi:hypothetical protein
MELVGLRWEPRQAAEAAFNPPETLWTSESETALHGVIEHKTGYD